MGAGGKITFAYDANGSLTTQTQTDASNNTVAGKSRAQFYTSFNMPQSMGQGTTSAAFYYGPEHQRVKQISSVQGTTVYVNPGNEGALFYEKDVKPDGSIEQRAFISAGGQTVAIVKATTSGGTTTTSVRYLHRDNLGSVTTVTNEAGAVIERLAYEPFGKRRFANGTADPNGTILPQNTDRGFTGHEMVDEIGLVHMNGRVYDPTIGRFMSADPYIQFAGDLQSYNRYSYLLNNPLWATDPSGYKINWGRVVRTVVAVVVAYYTGTWIGGEVTWAYAATSANAATIGSVAGGVAGGFAGGMVASGGDLKAGLYGAVGGGIGGAFAGTGMFGQMVGGGVNGYLQTGTAQGFARGFAAGAIPDDLGFASYRTSPEANIGIGIARDGLRGAIIGGRDGVIRGIGYGQLNNAIGHLVGATTGSYRGFKDGAFYYEGDFYDDVRTRPDGYRIAPAVTLGNVISGPNGIMTDPSFALLDRHERNHVFQSSERALGALYLIAHTVDVSIGYVGVSLSGTTKGYLLEEQVQNCPYSALHRGPASACR